LVDPAAYTINSLGQAYLIQRRGLAHRLASGDQLAGAKVGLSSPGAYTNHGLNEPIHGYLLGRHRLSSSEVAHARFSAPRVEFEIAVVLGQDDLNLQDGVAGIRESDAWVAPAIEIVDSRWHQNGRTAFHLVADDVSARAFIIGEAVPISQLDPGHLAVTGRIGAAQVRAGSDYLFAHPLAAMIWLAGQMAGERAPRTGQVFLTGTFIAPTPAKPGDAILADFGPIGVCSATFGDFDARSRMELNALAEERNQQ
jgi:2-keto-4-pentenoate hydratase